MLAIRQVLVVIREHLVITLFSWRPYDPLAKDKDSTARAETDSETNVTARQDSTYSCHRRVPRSACDRGRMPPLGDVIGHRVSTSAHGVTRFAQKVETKADVFLKQI